ncbi:hypothetical protein [Aquimarina sp. MAR_2010_214]|uniref:hypothetical protein n=1 Tax=Aquimarina sp. MAR_2010_214 TaxID=1250026 RepID=UPI00117825DD|nr:hypothetical protein [Aquimarina sp. MAR_2010_214]
MTKEDYKFYVPYLGTLLILLGATKLTIYYSLFGVNIASYLEFSEILTLFLNDLLYFIAIIFIVNLLMFLMQPNNELENISKGLHDTLTEKNLLKRILAYAVNGINLLILTLIWVIGIPFWFWLSKLPFTTYLYYFYPILCLILLLTIIYETRRQWFIKFKEHPKMIYTNLAKLFIILLGLTISSAYQDFKSVKTNKKYLGTTLKLSDRNVVSDSSYYYIGKTRNFIFFHDQKKKINDIFPMNEIKMLTEKKNNH